MMSDRYANTDNAVGLTQALVRIRSDNPTGNEEEMADFVAGWFRRLPVEVHVDLVEPSAPTSSPGCGVAATLPSPMWRIPTPFRPARVGRAIPSAASSSTDASTAAARPT